MEYELFRKSVATGVPEILCVESPPVRLESLEVRVPGQNHHQSRRCFPGGFSAHELIQGDGSLSVLHNSLPPPPWCRETTPILLGLGQNIDGNEDSLDSFGVGFYCTFDIVHVVCPSCPLFPTQGRRTMHVGTYIAKNLNTEPLLYKDTKGCQEPLIRSLAISHELELFGPRPLQGEG